MDLICLLSSSGPDSFPHTRGDGPSVINAISIDYQFSPHTWGWTHNTLSHQRRRAVFPTHVGMDLLAFFYIVEIIGFPHTRGDGSTGKLIEAIKKKFSPHTWGWTFILLLGISDMFVFPTHVGMDLGIICQ